MTGSSRGWLTRFFESWAVVVVLGIAAILTFAIVGGEVAAHQTRGFDGAVRDWIVAHQVPSLVTFFVWVSTIGATRNMYGIAIAAAAYLFYRGHRRVAASVLLAPVVAIGFFESAKRLYSRPRPPGLGHVFEGNTFSFPSAHATASAAVCCTLAYVYWREGIIRPVVALLVAIAVPLLIGVSRVYLDAHWTTDVIGGWTAGIIVAALCCGLYNRYRGRRVRAAGAAATMALVVFAPRSFAQSANPDVVINHRDMALIGAATAASLGLTALDVRIAHAFTDSAFHVRHPGITSAAKRASLVTETVLMISGGATWAVARWSRDQGTADVALHTTESIASAAVFIQVVRGALGRARPYVLTDSGAIRDADPHEFQPLHGFTSFNYRSYPSMHAMASFAAATGLVQEMRYRHTPHREIVTPLLYVAATAPALARMYLDEHWTSDIAMGVFLGVFSGQKVVGYSHAHPGNWVDHKFLKHATIAVSHDASGFGLRLLPF
jgi:membrane-associated phospholipid phosphatase